MNHDLFGDVAEVEGQDEGLDDVADVSSITVHQSVVSGTDWTAETIISQIDKGNIQLNPRFQRRDAWENSRKSQFIESLILGLPIPQVVLAESPSKRGSYIVIDGKQRLLSIRQFAAHANDHTFVPLKLSGLTIREDLKGETLDTLRSDPARSDDVSAFENQPIRTVVIKNWGSENFLYQVFLRLNTGSVPLSTQELRQALHPGDFLEYIDEESVRSVGLKRVLKLKKPDFRMRDAELLTRWYAFQHFAPSYSGDLKKFLDDSCAALNVEWGRLENYIRGELIDFEESVKTTYNIFGDGAFRKWTSGNYERLFNRAIFDVMTYYFAIPNVRAAAEAMPKNVVAAFQDLCDNDEQFRASIERTTKSVGATSTRFNAWAAALNKFGVNVVSPL